MALFLIDALLARDLSHQIIKVDDIVLRLNVINATRQKCITTGHHQTDHGLTSYYYCITNFKSIVPGTVSKLTCTLLKYLR